MKKVIGYVRVSTTQQNYDRQVEMIKQICSIHDYELLDIYSDKQSGADNSREGYQKILHLPKGAADYIIVSELSRLTRQADLMRAIVDFDDILQKGIGVQFPEGNDLYNMIVYEPYKQFAFEDIINLICIFYRAAKERETISNRMQSGKMFMFSNNSNMCVSKVPFGYTKVENPNYKQYKTPATLLVRDETAKYVEMMFQWCADGFTITQIQNKLNTLYEIKIALSSIGNILHNEIYKGVWSFSSITKQGDAIVSEELFDKVQMELQKHSANKKGKVNFHLLKGIIKCGDCGHNMTTAEKRGKLLYRCQMQLSTTKYNEKCHNGTIDAKKVNDAVWRSIVCSINSNEFINTTNEETKRIDGLLKDIDNDILYKSKEAVKLKEQMNTLGAKMATENNQSLYAIFRAKFEQMQKDYDAMIVTIEELKQSKNKHQETKEQMQANITNEKIDSMTDEQKAPIIKRYVSAATYYKEATNRGFLVVTFKNGVEIVYLLLAKKSVQLPSGFKFNKETKKVEVQTKSRPTMQGMTFQTSIASYDSMELENNFPDIMTQNVIDE